MWMLEKKVMGVYKIDKKPTTYESYSRNCEFIYDTRRTLMLPVKLEPLSPWLMLVGDKVPRLAKHCVGDSNCGKSI